MLAWLCGDVPLPLPRHTAMSSPAVAFYSLPLPLAQCLSCVTDAGLRFAVCAKKFREPLLGSHTLCCCFGDGVFRRCDRTSPDGRRGIRRPAAQGLTLDDVQGDGETADSQPSMESKLAARCHSAVSPTLTTSLHAELLNNDVTVYEARGTGAVGCWGARVVVRGDRATLLCRPTLR